MAILLRGKTQCKICGDIIRDGDDVVLFPHFILNENDPLYLLSDGAYHSSCIKSDARGLEMLHEARTYASKVGPGKRTCVVCGTEVIDPDDYLLIGRLGQPSIGKITDFNYTHLHKSHIKDWTRVDEFLELAKNLVATGKWRGTWLPDIIEQIKASR